MKEEARIASECARMEADMKRRGLMTPANDTPLHHAQRLEWTSHCISELGDYPAASAVAE